jgi:Peptidase of plants and bacteria
MRFPLVFAPEFGPSAGVALGKQSTAAFRGLVRTFQLAAFLGVFAAARAGTVQFDASVAPAAKAWTDSATALAREWYPRLGNLLASSDEVRLPDVKIVLSTNYDGVAAASGNAITMSARRVVELPDDSRGVVIHELVHVVQAYPAGSESWLTEGVADYLRCAVFEAMPLSDFPRPDKERGYRDSYKVAAGFLFWLESGPAPGIVRQVNALLRNGAYRESVFMDRTGRDLPRLWKEYLAAFSSSAPLPAATRLWRHAKGWFEHRPDGSWAEFEDGKQIWTFRETARTADYIELLDPGRNIRLRLTAREVRLGSEGAWPALYHGTWDSAP